MNKYGLEAKENWIAARIDELLDDGGFVELWASEGYGWVEEYAKQVAEREHAAIMADLEDERINLHRGDYE